MPTTVRFGDVDMIESFDQTPESSVPPSPRYPHYVPEHNFAEASIPYSATAAHISTPYPFTPVLTPDSSFGDNNILCSPHEAPWTPFTPHDFLNFSPHMVAHVPDTQSSKSMGYSIKEAQYTLPVDAPPAHTDYDSTGLHKCLLELKDRDYNLSYTPDSKENGIYNIEAISRYRDHPATWDRLTDILIHHDQLPVTASLQIASQHPKGITVDDLLQGIHARLQAIADREYYTLTNQTRQSAIVRARDRRARGDHVRLIDWLPPSDRNLFGFAPAGGASNRWLMVTSEPNGVFHTITSQTLV